MAKLTARFNDPFQDTAWVLESGERYSYEVKDDVIQFEHGDSVYLLPTAGLRSVVFTDQD